MLFLSWFRLGLVLPISVRNWPGMGLVDCCVLSTNGFGYPCHDCDLLAWSCANLLYLFIGSFCYQRQHSIFLILTTCHLSMILLSTFCACFPFCLICIIFLQRSLFTPYFKYLLEGSVQYLSEDDALISSKQKKKKAKLEDAPVEQKDKLSGPKLWNLRALVLKSLHKCFLYDNDQKILDSSNFQVRSFITYEV